MLKKLTLISLVALATFACQKQTFVVNKHAKYTQMPSRPTYEEWDHQFISGLLPVSKHNAVEMCNGNVDIVGTKQSFLNGLISVVTYGLYTPRTYQVQCAQ